MNWVTIIDILPSRSIAITHYHFTEGVWWRPPSSLSLWWGSPGSLGCLQWERRGRSLLTSLSLPMCFRWAVNNIHNYCSVCEQLQLWRTCNCLQDVRVLANCYRILLYLCSIYIMLQLTKTLDKNVLHIITARLHYCSKIGHQWIPMHIYEATCGIVHLKDDWASSTCVIDASLNYVTWLFSTPCNLSVFAFHLIYIIITIANMCKYDYGCQAVTVV